MVSKLKQGLNKVFSIYPITDKYLHFGVITGVVWQLLTSSLIEEQNDTLLINISDISFLHFYGGAVLLPFSLVFSIKLLLKRGLLDLFPWLYGRFEVIKQDGRSILTLKMPETRPSGLAACIEGFGVLALLLGLSTGICWYLVLYLVGPNELLLEVHELSVAFIQIYFLGHGGAAVLHLIMWWRGPSIT